MSQKKQFSSSGDIVLPALKGVVRTSPWLTLIESEKVVYHKSSTSKVTLLSGGGSGHEPTHAGFVGDGMLSAAVCGSIFASPSTKQIYAGLKAIESPKGTLIIVKNYTGDVIHFGLAAERAKSHDQKVEVVIVGDDVAVGKAQGGLVGRRGLSGTVLVHKIAGAAAELGLDLHQVANVARAVIDNTVTIAASLDHCNVPGRAFETNLSANEIEIGMGIHNEPGVKKTSPIPSIPDLVSSLLPMLVSQDDPDRSFVQFQSTDEVILMINNLGGLSNLEMSFATEVVSKKLIKEYKIVPQRTVCGSFTTAMNGAGFSITLLNATRAGGSEILKYFDLPVRASGWNQAAQVSEWSAVAEGEIPTILQGPEIIKNQKPSGIKTNPELFKELLKSGIEQVMKEEPQITKYDTIAGDGDCGETLVQGGNAIMKGIEDGSIRLDDGVNAISDIADLVEDSMGGTSGGLYSIYLSALAKGVRDTGTQSYSEECFAKASKSALESLFKYTRARVGDRTLIDCLVPFVEALSKGFEVAVEEAVKGANSTRQLEAKFGRASYVSKEELKNFDEEGGLPDPGAIGLAALLSGMLKSYSS